MRTPVNKFENKLRVVYRLDITNPHRKGLRCTTIMATIMATIMTSMSSITIESHLMEVYTLCKGDIYDYVGYQGPSWSWRRRGGNHHCFWCHLIMVEITNTSSLSIHNIIVIRLPTAGGGALIPEGPGDEASKVNNMIANKLMTRISCSGQYCWGSSLWQRQGWWYWQSLRPSRWGFWWSLRRRSGRGREGHLGLSVTDPSYKHRRRFRNLYVHVVALYEHPAVLDPQFPGGFCKATGPSIQQHV